MFTLRLLKPNYLYVETFVNKESIYFLWKRGITAEAGKIPVKSNAYNVFKEYVTNNNRNDEETVLEDLLTYSKYYSWFLFSESPYVSVNDLLQQIQQLKSTVIYPTLLFVFEDCFGKSLFSIETLEDILKIFISYLYRRLICGYATNALNKVFAAFPVDIYKSSRELYNEKVLEMLTKKTGNAIFPRNEEFKNSFIRKKLYATKIDKYTLYELEKYKNKETVELNDDITIEHIMPQTLTPVWRKDLGKRYDEIQQEYLHTIGNLTLSAYNSNLSNKSFEEKRETLGNSNISISRNIKNYENWNEVSIKDRANTLYSIASEIWNLPEEYNKPVGSSKEIQYDVEYSLTDEINVTGESPRKLIIVDMEYSVESWKDVIRTICEELYYLDKEIFKTLTKHKDFGGRTKRRIGETSENMRVAHKLADNIYIDLHGSAVELINYCILIAEKFEMENDISFMLKPKYN